MIENLVDKIQCFGDLVVLDATLGGVGQHVHSLGNIVEMMEAVEHAEPSSDNLVYLDEEVEKLREIAGALVKYRERWSK